ncbi:MAG: DNA repair protein RecN [Oscillospiraceae bacterium]|nr:DNA repair protein RecN [Oscillospiraceae bacterium]
MLQNLKINNIAIIKEAVIDFNNGLNVLTGETGAGKSIIIDAINAVLGERTSRELIRTGSDFAEVSALFSDINSSVKSALLEIGITPEEDETLLILRKIFADGKNICKINGQSVTVSMLKRIGRTLINIHGQLDNQNLLNEDYHIFYIDSFAQNDDIKSEYQLAFNDFKEAERKYKSFIENESEKARKIDILTYQTEEIEAADIKVGEYSDLIKRRNFLQNAESLLELVSSALSSLDGQDGENGAVSQVSFAASSLQKAIDYDDSLKTVSETLTDISYSLSDCISTLNDFLFSADVDPRELDDIEERLSLLESIFKKYGETEEDVLKYFENAQKELEEITFSDQIKEKLKAVADEKRIIMQNAADKLSEARKSASIQFAEKVAEELAFLEMPSIVFKIVQNKVECTENGQDEIYFLISANVGEEPKALSKIASGGELSRIMLAIKNVLASNDEIQTLIFDEIDTGVSGRTAQKIGIKLKEVSFDRQVLCVTHLAQIAAFANSHYLISKSERDNKTFTDVKHIEYGERVSELSRIIGGIESTDISKQAAAELIDYAENYFLDKN